MPYNWKLHAFLCFNCLITIMSNLYHFQVFSIYQLERKCNFKRDKTNYRMWKIKQRQHYQLKWLDQVVYRNRQINWFSKASLNVRSWLNLIKTTCMLHAVQDWVCFCIEVKFYFSTYKLLLWDCQRSEKHYTGSPYTQSTMTTNATKDACSRICSRTEFCFHIPDSVQI